MSLINGLIRFVVKNATIPNTKARSNPSLSKPPSIDQKVSVPWFSVNDFPNNGKPMLKSDVLRAYRKIRSILFPLECSEVRALEVNELSETINEYQNMLKIMVEDAELELKDIKDSIREMQREKKGLDDEMKSAIDDDIESEKLWYAEDYSEKVLPLKVRLKEFKSDKKEFFVQYLNEKFHNDQSLSRSYY